MIKQNKGETLIDGDINTILNEIATLTHLVCKDISDNTSSPYEKVLGQIQDSMQLYKLVDAGMTPEEAMEVTGMDAKIRRMEVTDTDGNMRTIKGKCHDTQRA